MKLNRFWIFGVFIGFWLAPVARADDWPQWLGPNRDSVWREDGIIEKFPDGGPKIRWHTPIGAGYSGPVVAAGRVFVTDRVLGEGTSNPSNPFARGSIAGSERLLCLKESDGSVLWKDEYPCAYTISYAAGPRATPIVSGSKVYTVGAEGDVRCLDVADGNLIWKAKLGTNTPMWGYAAAPLIEGKALICIGDGRDALVIAFDKETGQVLWKALHAREPGYSSPMICQAGGKRQLIVWDPQKLTSLDPNNGNEYWSVPFSSKSGMSLATPRQSGDLLLISAFYDGSLMLRLEHDKPTVTEVWRKKGKNEQHEDVLHALMCTPFIKDGYIYGVSAYGQLRCLRVDTGEKAWETFAATTGDGGPVRWANAFIVANGDRFFLPNEHGDLIIARLAPDGYHEISRTHLIDPTNKDAQRVVVWSHPAFANRCIYLRNDKEIICALLATER